MSMASVSEHRTQEVIFNLAIANKISPDALLSDADGSNDMLLGTQMWLVFNWPCQPQGY